MFSNELTGVLAALEALKDVQRAGWLRAGIKAPESTAAHSWGTALLALILCPDGIDRSRAVQIALVHDLAEISVGDITPHDNVSTAEKHAAEAAAFRELTCGLPRRELLMELFEEYSRAETAEAKLVHNLDKLDMALQAVRYEQSRAENLHLREFADSALEYAEKHPMPPALSSAEGAANYETFLMQVLKDCREHTSLKSGTHECS